jgi:hypothetical protein
MALKWIKQQLPEQPITRWAIALNLSVLACIYFDWLLGYLGEVPWLFLPIRFLFILFILFILFVFSQFHVTIIIFFTCLGLMVLALIWERPRPLATGCFVLFLLAYAAWPLTVEKYEPVIQPLPSYKMQLVTDTGYFGSAIKSKLTRYEGNTCDYELLGWDESNVLYYESNCGFGKKLWRYDPILSRREQVNRIPAGIELTPVVKSRTTWVFPPKIIRPTRHANGDINSYVHAYAHSPDRQWTAMESSYIYSVHDVVVLKKRSK